MNYTNNYHLPQWEKSDRIMMDDFNQAMSNIEAGIARTAQDAAGDSNGAAQAAAQALEAAQKAQSTADSARSTANNAYRPGYYPYAVGTYRGVGTYATATVHLGFAPSAVLIAGVRKTLATDTWGNACMAIAGQPTSGITCTATGFTVNIENVKGTPDINDSNQIYGYIAFR